MHKPVRILGIDPGLQRTGWGIIESNSNRISFIAAGVIKPETDGALNLRLQSLHAGLQEVILQHRPQEAAVEETFVNVSGSSTLKLGQARGAILLSLSIAGLAIGEYAATLVKKSIVGTGHADKHQIAAMVGCLLPGCGKHGADAMDALAVAICHANHRNTRNYIAAQS